jgi:hypothetical protein
MSIPFARLGIPAPLRRSVDPESPRSAKVAVAKGLLPTTADVQLSLLYVLAVDPDRTVARMARKTLAGLPESQIISGLNQRTFPKILEFIAKFRKESQVLDEKIIRIRDTPDRAAVLIAHRAEVGLCEMLCRHQERLLLTPEVYVALHANPECNDEDLGRAEAFLRMHKSLPEVPAHRPFREPEPAPEPVAAELVPQPAQPAAPLTPGPLTPAPTQPALQPAQQSADALKMFDLDTIGGDDDQGLEAFQFNFQDEMANFSWDLTGDDDVAEVPAEEEEMQFISVERRIAEMSVGQKIKMAYMGNKSARKVLIRDSNKIVATAVVKSGRLSPSEVAAFAGNRNLGDGVIREIAMNPEFLRKYPVQVALVNNPKTPPAVALKFISGLHKRDLKALSNNKNVGSVIFLTAKKLFKSKYQK